MQNWGLAVSWVAAALAVLCGCDRGSNTSSTPVPREPLRVVATVYPLADVARLVGGREVRVEWVLESGQTLDGFEPDRDMLDRLRTAELVYGGGKSEPWAVEGFDDPLIARRIVRLDLLETARQSPGAAAGLWLDPLIVRESIGELAQRFSNLRPGGESLFRANSIDLTGKIDAILAAFRQRLDQLAGKVVITLGPDFSALTSRFGIVEVRPVLSSPSQLSDLDIARIRQTARERGATSLLIAADVPSAVSRDLGDRTGLRIVSIDLLGTSATAGGGNSTYLDLLRFNLEKLLTLK
jgi:ABC-type Zn uptake system ZnuABC Zn-binding protein ZnuA